MEVRTRFAAFFLATFALAAASAESQTLTAVEDFEGKESWLLLSPENVELNPRPLGWMRSGYDFRIRFQGESWTDMGAVIDFIKVGPMLDIEDGDGDARRVREVGLINESESQIITFYVTPDAPFFQGWDFRMVESGTIISRLRARGEPHTEAYGVPGWDPVRVGSGPDLPRRMDASRGRGVSDGGRDERW